MTKSHTIINFWKTASKKKRAVTTLIRKYLKSLTIKGYSQQTYNSRHYYLSRFAMWCSQRSIIEMDDISKQVIASYQLYVSHQKVKRTGKTLSINTQRLYLLAVNLFFCWLIKNREIIYNPTAALELPKRTTYLPRNILSQQDAEAIINQPNIEKPLGLRDRAILETLYSTGMRASELINLALEDLDKQRGTILIRQGKGQKDRIVPLGDRALLWIEKYLIQVRPPLLQSKKQNTLFLTKYGKPYSSTQAFTGLIKQYIKAANVHKSGCAHLFRHTMATLMLENGADITYIKEILGHADIGTTEIYTHVTIAKLAQVHALTHPAEIHWQPDEEQ
ncbi:tyrosine-type recombinase/integrase [Candidatus Uabimicrobium sp. HlEnr_7]|uniref:tyrosine-type recombinase/integrase n=1 Tax=Candidatus Uabimicrobium helgolandensis TaxID=3095367 RepID=UPI003558C6B7